MATVDIGRDDIADRIGIRNSQEGPVIIDLDLHSNKLHGIKPATAVEHEQFTVRFEKRHWGLEAILLDVFAEREQFALAERRKQMGGGMHSQLGPPGHRSRLPRAAFGSALELTPYVRHFVETHARFPFEFRPNAQQDSLLQRVN